MGIDTGGTFTDVVAVDEGSGRVVATKTPSTPADPAVGFMNAVHKVLAMLREEPSDDRRDGGEDTVGRLAAVSHGTTVATNQLLTGDIGGLGFITSEGYEFVLEIARQSVPDGYGNSYFWVKPDRIVPAHLVRTVPGRLDYQGSEIRPFDEQRAGEVARWFRDAGIDTIGVCFLHAYANPEHELAMREVLAAEHPGASVSISSEVLREYREYERSVTTLVDAAVKPRVSRYVANLTRNLAALGDRPERPLHDAPTDNTSHDVPDHAPQPADLGEIGVSKPRMTPAIPRSAESGGRSAESPEAYGSGDDAGVPFYVMKSNGGVLSADEVVDQPITTVLSGPAAGALGAAYLASHAGTDHIITLDGGGTSTDVALVLDGEPTLTTEGSVGRFPSRIPMIDVVTVGAGGGSIAWLSPEGTLKVGPRSAGADPGPMCYDRGGTEPTITDAHATLGRIPPHLLGGEVPLDVGVAREGLVRLAGSLGLDPEAAATGVLEISAWNQANAIRQVTVERGLDVRDFTMATFGGSGSLLACRLVDILGLRGVVVPPDPGTVSAYGLLTVDVKDDYVQTHVARHDDLDSDELASVYGVLETRAAAALDREGFAHTEHRYARTADIRYFGQAFEVRVPAPDGPVDPDFVATVEATFHDEHERLYGYCYREDPKHAPEWVNLRVSGIGRIRWPEPSALPGSQGGPERALTGKRPVHFGSWVDTPIYWRPGLGPGDEIAGPAVVEEFGSTVPVHPGFGLRVDTYGNLLLTRMEGDQ